MASITKFLTDPTHIFISFIALLVFYGFAKTLISYVRLRQFPGPWQARYTNFWYAKLVLSGSMATKTGVLFDRYGSLVRIGPNALVTCDADIIRRINGTRSHYARGPSYRAFRLGASSDSVLSLLDEGEHTTRRSKLTPGYSGKGNPKLEQQLDNRVLDLITLIDHKYKSRGSDLRPVDLAQVAQYFTLDTLTDIAYDHPFGYLMKDTDLHDYISTIRRTLPMTMLFSVLPAMGQLLETPLIKRLLAPGTHDIVGLGKVMGIAKQIISQRFGPNAKSKEDMLGAFIKNGLTQDECESESLLQILAGSDTTATALRVTLFHIISQPQVYNLLRAEIASFERDGRLSHPIPTDFECRALPYLQACIKEGLRICPPANAIMGRIVPVAGDTINGKYIPGGTEIGVGYWATMRDKEVFGSDAHLFRPERWIEGDEETTNRMNRQGELVFSFGRYQCMGKTIALMELNKCVLEMIRHYDWTRVDPNRPYDSVCYGICFQKDMWMRVSDRTHREEMHGELGTV